MDLFASKNLKPMLFYEGKLFNSEEYIYEIKFDGHRTIIYLDHNYINIRSRNNKDVTSLYPELNELKKLVKRKCILDGELIVLENGKPNFFKMQKRSLMTNTIRIKQESINNPVIFIAFDILYYDQKDLTNYPLIKRKEYLKKNVKENDYLIISKYVEYNGIELFKRIKKEQLEGIVAKRKDSIYQVNKRVHDWLKIKCIKEKDFYVLGIREENKKIKTIVIGSIKNNKLILNGQVNLPNKYDQEFMKKFIKEHKIKKAYFDMEHVIWLKLDLKCTIRYKEETQNNSLRHAVFVKFI